jgi:hypothetical protein
LKSEILFEIWNSELTPNSWLTPKFGFLDFGVKYGFRIVRLLKFYLKSEIRIWIRNPDLNPKSGFESEIRIWIRNPDLNPKSGFESEIRIWIRNPDLNPKSGFESEIRIWIRNPDLNPKSGYEISNPILILNLKFIWFYPSLIKRTFQTQTNAIMDGFIRVF